MASAASASAAPKLGAARNGVLKFCSSCQVQKGEVDYPARVSVNCDAHTGDWCRVCVAAHLKGQIQHADNKLDVECPECDVTLTRVEVEALAHKVDFDRFVEICLMASCGRGTLLTGGVLGI